MSCLALDAIRRQKAEKELQKIAEEKKDSENVRNARDNWGVLIHKQDFPIITGTTTWYLSRFIGQNGIPGHS